MAALFTYLFELSELPGPLSAFQATRFDKGETKQLVVALAKQLGDSAPSIQAIEANFEKTWGWFKAKLEAIQPLPIQKTVPGFERLFSVKTFAEPFPDCLDERWRERYQGIVETLTALRERDTEQLALHPYHSRLYHELIGQLERYATIVGGALLEEKKYRDIPEEHQERCEKTRSDVLKLTRLMLRSYNPPVFEESLQFRVFDAADDRNDLIHQMEIRLDKIPREKIERAKESLTWALDRIVFYLACAKKRARDIEPKYLAACVRREVEQARARGLIDRLQPLDHSVEALAENLPEGSERAKLTPLILTTLDQVERFLEGDARRDPGNDIRSWIATIRAQLEPATSRDGKLQAKVRDASRGLFPETSS